MEEEHLPHRLQLNERKSLTMTGVAEVVSFDENTVVLQTSLGLLVVQGQQLQLKNLTLEGGVRWRWRGASAAFPTRSLARPAGADCSDDPRDGGLPAGLRPGSGGGAGAFLRLSAASAAKIHGTGRRGISARCLLGLALL